MKLCSFIIPTRGRPRQLVESVESIFGTAADKDCVEVFLKVDDDDSATISVLPRIVNRNVRVLIAPRLGGYDDLWVFQSELTRLAVGDWVCYWNDDAIMKCEPPWDRALAAAPRCGFVVQPEIHQLNASRYYKDRRSGFPFFPRPIFTMSTARHPIDKAMVEGLYGQGWSPHFLPGVTIIHNRHEPKH